MQKMHTSSIRVGDSRAHNNILIIHGYTGSPDEFQDLAHELARRLDAHVHVPLLPGHGTSEEDLCTYTFDDLLKAVREHVREMAATGKPFALVGHSLGAHLALLVADAFPPVAAVLTVMPYRLRPPFSLPGMEFYARIQKFWDKQLTKKEIRDRENLFYYHRMPGTTLGMLKNANRRVESILSNLTFPICTIHNHEDPTSYAEGGEEIIRKSGGNTKSSVITLDRKEHGLFYGEGKEVAVEKIAAFLENVMGK